MKGEHGGGDGGLWREKTERGTDTVINDDVGPVAPVEGLELLGEEWVWNGRSVGEPVEGAAKRVWGEAATLRHVCTIEIAYGHAHHVRPRSPRTATLTTYGHAHHVRPRSPRTATLTTYGHAVHAAAERDSAHFFSSFYLERITLNRLR